MNPKVHVACHFTYLMETEGLLKATRGYGHPKSGNETVQHRDVVTTDREWEVIMTYRMTLTLSDLQGHLPIASLFK